MAILTAAQLFKLARDAGADAGLARIMAGAAHAEGQAKHFQGEQLAAWTYMRAERPQGWNGPSDPGLDSEAAQNFRTRWRQIAAVAGPGGGPTPGDCEAQLAEERSFSSALMHDV